MNNKKYYDINKEELYTKLKTSINGLTTEEALKRIKTNGKNTLPKKEKDSVFKIFFSKFLSLNS